MSFRTVRVLTSSRSASSDPVQAGRDCSRASRASSRDGASSISKVSLMNRNRGFLYGFYVPGMTNKDIRSFRVDVPQADLDDLIERLARTRLPQPSPTDDWEYGTPNSYVAETVEYWLNEFDWRAAEARMNEFPQYVTEID